MPKTYPALPGIRLMRPVERVKVLRPVVRGPIDSEPGQDGQGWDAGDGFVRSPIDDDAGTFRDRNIAPWGDDAGGDFVRHPPDTDAGTFASRSPVDDDAGGF